MVEVFLWNEETALSRFFDVIGGVENVVLAIMVVGMIFTILVQIIGRVIGHPFPWTEETSRYLFLWMMFVALAAGFNQAESSRVTLFVAKGPKWLRKFSEILYAVIVTAFFCLYDNLRLGSGPSADHDEGNGNSSDDSHVHNRYFASRLPVYLALSASCRASWNIMEILR